MTMYNPQKLHPVSYVTSLINVIKNNFIVEFLEAICEPYLKIFRKIIPPFGMLDISPIAALVVLSVIENLIIMLLFKLS